MAGQSEIPWYHSDPRIGSSIADLLVRQGDIQAQRAQQVGNLWANAVGNVGNIAAGAVQQHQEQKQKSNRDKILGEAMQSWNPENPQEFMRKMITVGGPEFALSGVRAMTALEESRRKAEPDPKLLATKAEFIGRAWKKSPDFVRNNWAMFASAVPEVTPLRGIEVGQEWDEEKYAPLLDSLSPEEKPTTPIAIDPTKNYVVPSKDGFAPAPGIAAAVTPPEKPDTRSVEARYADAVARGDTAGAQAMLQAQSRLAAAGRASQAPSGGGGKDDTGRTLAKAWADGRSFPSTQAAKTSALVYMDKHPEEFPNKPRSLSVGQQGEVLSATNTLGTIDRVKRAYEKVKEKIGPVTYTFNEWTRKLPGFASDPDFVTFNTLLRGMGNLEIKRITGAQMSEKEADRLLKGMATGSLKPEDFEAAINVMASNAKQNREVTLYGKAIEGTDNDPASWTAMPGGLRIREKR